MIGMFCLLLGTKRTRPQPNPGRESRVGGILDNLLAFLG